MSFTEAIMLKVRKAIDDTLARWNPFTGDHPIVVPGNALPPAEDSPYAPAGSAYDARFLWGRPLQEGPPEQGNAYLWDEEAEAFVLGAAGGGGGTGVAFRAHVASDYTLSTTPARLDASDEHYDLGELYDTSTSAWTPPAGPVAFMYRVRLDDNIQPQVSLRKNGSEVYYKTGGRYADGGGAYDELFFMDNASGTDVYELWVSGTGAGSTTIHAGDTFWAGMTGGVGGGGGGAPGGGGGVPAPFVYITDDDGYYLIDDDGAYLWEPLL